jgi:DNA polymerase-1
LKKTLLIDSNNLFKIGFFGVKEIYNGGARVGGIYHFINTIRKFLEENNYDKVIAVWDGDENSFTRKSIYPKYKENRNHFVNSNDIESTSYQVGRIKQYLEEVFVRQIEVSHNECDDLISYYCSVASDEDITIFSSDKDFTQLISDRVRIYSPVSKRYYNNGDMITINKVEIPHYNVLLCKVFTGDKSDNIEGIEGLGEKTFMKLFPILREKPCTIEELLNIARENQQKNKIKSLSNILEGKTKSGILGEDFYNVNKKIVDLSEPLITEDGKTLVEQIVNDSIDPTDRGYKNLMRMMMEDALFMYLPKDDNAWVNFLRPFMKLIRKEKRNANKN